MSSEHEWPTEQCPPWCVADHTEHLMPQDFLHEGALVTVPAVALHWDHVPDRPGRREPLAVTLDIVRYRYPGDANEWVYIGSEGGLGLDISMESVGRLAEALARLAGNDASSRQ